MPPTNSRPHPLAPQPAPAPLVVGCHTFDLRRRPILMGIVNVTPDSFSDGGLFLDPQAALNQALQLAADGADILDIGGESTRPFADPVSLQEELQRVIPLIQAIRRQNDIPISIDTYKAAVAQAALDAGANLINDISALRFDPQMVHVAAKAAVPVVLMHMQGQPRTMQLAPHYDDVVREVKAFLAERRDFALAHGILPQNLILDVGIGFGKDLNHNLELLRHLEAFHDLGCPLLLGVSRKAFIGKLLDTPVTARDIGTLGAIAIGLAKGVQIIRTHNIQLAKQLTTVMTAVLYGHET
ncbi:MAG: dihydropteroate synthase [Desulfobacca sp.]|uniref:dihydropteroate synthase n=1 Tax=Desulfobacca sp. TaxID=2067990 RepID=UPI00404A8372